MTATGPAAADEIATTDSIGPDDAPDRPSISRLSSSLRVRIVIGFLVLMATGLAVTIVIARNVQQTRSDREIEASLVSQRNELALAAAETESGDDVRSVFNSFLSLHAPSDNEAFYTIPLDGDLGTGMRRSFGAPEEVLQDRELLESWAAASRPILGTYDTPAGKARAMVIPVLAHQEGASDALEGTEPISDPRAIPDVLGVLVVAHFLDAHDEELAELVRSLVLVALAVLVVSTVIVWAVAGRILTPVRALTEAAQAVTHSDLSARIPVSGRDELSELGMTFNEMMERLDNGVRNQRQFLDDVAHDLRTPLTIARGHLETLGDDPNERNESMAIVLDELDRMGRSVSDLLVLAKAGQPHFLRLQAIDYGDFATDVMQRVTQLADREWTLDAAPRPGLVAGEADVQRLLEAVLNLATNAAQHTEPRSRIDISVVPDGLGNVAIRVRDHGPGIDVDDADVLFQRHHRGQKAGHWRDGKHHDGIGLGLSITDAIARAHGGDVRHDPTPGGGATFTITIPLEPPVDAITDPPGRRP